MGLNPDLAAEQPISTKEKQRSIRHKLVSLTLKRKNKMGDEIKKKLQEEEYTADSYNSWLESRYVLTFYFRSLKFLFILHFDLTSFLEILFFLQANFQFRKITFHH